MDDFGLTFSPATTTDRSKAQADPNAPVTEAIRTLSLNIPRVVGSKSIAPQALLTAPGSQGLASPNGMNLEQILAMLFGVRPNGPQSPGTATITNIGFGSPQTSQPPAPNVQFEQPPAPASAPMAPSIPSKYVPEVRMPEGMY